MKDKEKKEEIHYSCFNCGSTFDLKKLKEKWVCEKCAFWYDTHDDSKPKPLSSSPMPH